MWVATRLGRLFVTRNADAGDPSAVTFTASTRRARRRASSAASRSTRRPQPRVRVLLGLQRGDPDHAGPRLRRALRPPHGPRALPRHLARPRRPADHRRRLRRRHGRPVRGDGLRRPAPARQGAALEQRRRRIAAGLGPRADDRAVRGASSTPRRTGARPTACDCRGATATNLGRVLVALLELVVAPALVGASTLAARRWGEASAGWSARSRPSSGPSCSSPPTSTAALRGQDGERDAARARRPQRLRPRLRAHGAARRLAREPRCRLGGRGGDRRPARDRRGRAARRTRRRHALAARGSPRAAARRAARAADAGAPPRWDLALRMVLTAVLVVSLAAAASRLGPVVGGMLAALPALASILAVFTHEQHGARGPRLPSARNAQRHGGIRRLLRPRGRARRPGGRRRDLRRRPRSPPSACRARRRPPLAALAPSRIRLISRRSFQLARRIAMAIIGAPIFEKPAGSPRLRSVIRVPPSGVSAHV